MFCSSCGKEVQDSVNFCSHCGTQVGVASLAVQEPMASNESSKLKSAYSSVGQAISQATSTVSNIVNTVALEVGDLNGDGKIDAEDFKIAAAKAKELGAATVDEAVRIGKEALKSDMAKDAAAGAAVGAAIAVPIPIVGPATGAVVGAGLGVYKNITKK